MDGLEQLIDHLKNFVNPLRTFLEAKIDVGKVAAVRRAAKDAPTTTIPHPAPGYSPRAVSGEVSIATPLSAASPVLVKSGWQKLTDLVNGLRQIHALGGNTYPIVLGSMTPLLRIPWLLTIEQLRVSPVLATLSLGQSTTGVDSRILPRRCKHIRAFQ